MNELNDEGLIQEFLAESRDHLGAIEPDLLTLEREGKAVSDDVVNSIFRAIHSIKGASGFFGFESLKTFSHIMESVLMMIRDKKIEPEPDTIDVLLRGVDRLSEMVDDIQNSDSVDISKEEVQLQAIMKGEPASSSEKTASVAQVVSQESSRDESKLSHPIFDLTTPQVQLSHDQGHYFFELTIQWDDDIVAAGRTVEELVATCESLGTILESSMPLDTLMAITGADEPPESFQVLFSSVIELDLIPAALQLPEERVALIEPSVESKLSHPIFDLTTPQVQLSHDQGHYFFELTIQWDDDIVAAGRTVEELVATCESLGTILESSMPLDTLMAITGADEPPESFQVLFSSVIELDLIPAALQLPEERVALIELNSDAAPVSVDEVVNETVEEKIVEPPKRNEPVGPPYTDHPLETLETIEPVKSKAVVATTSTKNESIRVRVELLNRLMNLAGEMVLLRNQLNQKLENNLEKVEGLATVLQNINTTTTDLQEHIMQTRMQPIGNVFSKFHRVVRDIARTLSKEINIKISGDEVELDKSIVETLSDPLTHLIRNSCDHGIESTADRISAGKPSVGTVHLNAYQEGGQIIISIQDDGKGINADILAEKAVSKGILTPEEASRLSVKEKVNLIFHPGFSMAAQVSDISGRGVGMDVVKTNIEKIGGSITVETEVGMGTIIYLHLPLTLAIIPSLLVGVNEYSFAIPQINVVELIRVKAEDSAHQLERIGQASVLKLRGKLLPLLRLSDVLDIPRYYTDPDTQKLEADRRDMIADRRNVANASHPEMLEDIQEWHPRTQIDRREELPEDFNVVVLKLSGKQYGLIVEEVHNLEEIVVKPLSCYLADCQCFTGSTIMGDGQVSMILDVAGIANYSNLDFSNVEKEEENRHDMGSELDSDLVSYDVILFSNGPESDPNADHFAVDLSSVLRLEKFDVSTIQLVGRRECLTYQGRSLPLIRLENALPIGSPEAGGDEAYLIIPKASGGRVGIVANRIIDVDSIKINLESSFIEHEGVLGSAVINERITTFINPDGLLDNVGLASYKKKELINA